MSKKNLKLDLVKLPGGSVRYDTSVTVIGSMSGSTSTSGYTYSSNASDIMTTTLKSKNRYFGACGGTYTNSAGANGTGNGGGGSTTDATKYAGGNGICILMVPVYK